jgi:hypothetical protein
MKEAARAPFAASRSEIADAADLFKTHTATKTWCQLPRVSHGHQEAIVAGVLTKRSLMNLYDEGVVKNSGQPRKIYDEILVAAQGSCPYCAGIGNPRTLDHYLPKSKFPALSVHPHNLIPACRDCNTDAGAGFSDLEVEQPIHPYFDKDSFFLERWVRGRVIRCDPIVVQFFADPPERWEEVDKRRAKKHFIDCKLRDRFGSQVAGELSSLVLHRKSSLAVFTPPQFEAHLRIVADDPKLLLNGWKRTMYLALAETPWFCSADFNGNWLIE